MQVQAARSMILLVTWGLLLVTPLLAEEPETIIPLARFPLWFVDDSGIESRTDLSRSVHLAKTLSHPVLEADQPWEAHRVYIYGSVYADSQSGELRMWYMSRSSVSDGKDEVLLATSTDGLNWKKPALGITEFSGSRDNNIVFDLHSPSVLWDPDEKDPARRFKMLGSQKGKKSYRNYDAAFSPDGLHWTYHPENPAIPSSDTITLTQHPVTGEYLAYHKRAGKPGEESQRQVWLARSADFNHWSEPEMVLAADAEDNSWASRPPERTEIYDMSVYPHAAGLLGLPAMFRLITEHPRGQSAPGQSRQNGPIDIQLVTSIDGRKWERTLPRVNVIPRGAPGTFDAGAILGVSSTPVHIGDKTWVYYTALTTGHGGAVPTKQITIGRAEWRRDGFVSLDADPHGGSLETKPLRLSSPDLFVNADATRGELRVALMEANGDPIAGFALEECEPLQQDQTRWGVRWKGGAVPTDRSVKVAIAMKNCRLYSLASGSIPPSPTPSP